MKTMLRKSILLILTIMMLTISVSATWCTAQAASSKKTTTIVKAYYISVDSAPRVTFDKTKEKQLIIKFTDNYQNGKNAIRRIRIEKVAEEGQTLKESQLLLDDEIGAGNGKRSNSDGQYPQLKSADGKSILTVALNANGDTATIPAEYFEKNKTVKLKITVSDNDSVKNTMKGTYIIKRLEKKNSSGNYFSINCAPGIGFVNAGKENLYSTQAKAIKNFRLKYKDNNGLKSFYIYDRNNNNNIRTSFAEMDKTHVRTSFIGSVSEIANCQLKDGRFKIQVKVTAGGAGKSTTTRIEQIDLKVKTLTSKTGIMVKE